MSEPSAGFAGTQRFEILATLGEGGMGVVYEALDRERGTRVAIKALRELSADAIRRFKQEFRALRDIQHPNLVSLGELIEDQGRWFFTMELVEGTHFLDYVRPRGEEPASVDPDVPLAAPLDLPRLRHALAELAVGLSALHTAGKVHRDIKPSNLIVTNEDRLILLDFGLVMDVSDGGDNGTDGGTRVGTAAYMAPEQASADAVGPAADWYSVGVVLYEALTGELPFPGHPLEVLARKQKHDPPPPRTLAPDIPEDLDALCAALLRRRPQDRPTGGEVLERLGLGRPTPATAGEGEAHPTEGSVFVGRSKELSILEDAFEASQSRRPVSVVVYGASGMGKTTLVHHFVRGLEARSGLDVSVLHGRCHERELVPYKAVDGIMEDLAQVLTDLGPSAADVLPPRVGLLAQTFPALRRVESVVQAPLPDEEVRDPRERRRRVFAELRELLLGLTARRGLVMAIDDLQWADADSLSLLGEVMRPPEAPPVLVVATIRTPPGGDETVPLVRIAGYLHGDLRRIKLGPLPEDDATQLVKRLVEAAGAPPLADAGALAREAGGHPLFIEEIVRHAVAQKSRPRAQQHLEDALWARVEALEDAERRIVELVAAAGAPVPQEIIARAAIVHRDFGKLVASLQHKRLVGTSGVRARDVIDLFHSRLRETILAFLGADRRAGLHRRLAIAHEAAQHPDYEALAYHWEMAGETRKAAHYAALAGDRANGALAFDRAASLYQKALALRADDDVESRLRLLVALGEALILAGRGAESARAFLDAAEIAPAARAVELRRIAADQLLRSGHVDRGVEIMKTVLDDAGLSFPESPRSALLSFLYQRARVRLGGYRYALRAGQHVSPDAALAMDVCRAVSLGLAVVDPLRGADFQARYLRRALASGDPERIGPALAAEAGYCAALGGRARHRAERLLDEAVKVSEKQGTVQSQGHVAALAGIMAFVAARFHEARDWCQKAETLLAGQGGSAYELANARQFGLYSLIYLGELGQAARRLPLLLRDAEERGDQYSVTNLKVGHAHMIYLGQDDPERARQESGEGMRRWSHRSYLVQHAVDFWAHVQIDLYLGDPSGAWRRIMTDWPFLQRSLQMRVQFMRITMRSVRGRTAVATLPEQPPSEQKRLLKEAEAMSRALDREGERWASSQARIIDAGRAAFEGRIEDARRALEQAIEGFEADDLALFASSCRRRLGLLVGGSEGEALVAEADRWLGDHGTRRPDLLARVLAP